MAFVYKGLLALLSIMVILPAIILGLMMIALILPESRTYFKKGIALLATQVREILACFERSAP